MESFFSQLPNVKISLIKQDESIKRSVYDFVCFVERTSPYTSTVKFYLVETDENSFNARLEVSTSSFEILLTKKSASVETLLVELRQSFSDRLKPWLEGRFSA